MIFVISPCPFDGTIVEGRQGKGKIIGRDKAIVEAPIGEIAPLALMSSLYPNNIRCLDNHRANLMDL